MFKYFLLCKVPKSWHSPKVSMIFDYLRGFNLETIRGSKIINLSLDYLINPLNIFVSLPIGLVGSTICLD